jgi:cell division protein FtsQ
MKRGSPPRRPVQPKRRQPPKPSIIDRIIAVLPVSEATLRRIATWSIFTIVCASALAVATWFGIPGAIGVKLAEGIGEAGFRVEQVEVTGLSRMDRMTVYAVALDQRSRAMPLVNLEDVRHKLLAYGWIADAHVSRRLPDTLLVHIVERQPTAVWQDQGKLSLIAADGVWLEPVKADAMPDLPQVKAATWVGKRRWNLLFESGETLALPEGDADASKALTKFAQMDGVHPLLGKGWVRFDMRDPNKFVSRKPGQVSNRALTDPNTVNAPAKPALIEAQPAKPALIEAKHTAPSTSEG